MATIAENLQTIKDSTEAIKQAIIDKGGTISGGLTTYADAIKNISGGGESGSTNGSVSKSDVNFYDYDGTLLYSYTKSTFLALSVLPDLPTRERLTCQGWNYNLSDAKEYVEEYCVLDIGATYITDDGKTRLYINIATDGRMAISIYFSQTVSDGVTIDWGDGSTQQTISGTGNKNKTHTYNDIGDYVITLNPKSGCNLGLGNGSYSSCILGTTEQIGRLSSFLKKIEIGNSVTGIGSYAFKKCYSLSSIVIPNSVKSISNDSFNGCYSLSSIVLPNSVNIIGVSAFYDCRSLSNIVIPNSVTSVGYNAFYYCYSLSSIVIPNSVTSISDSAFSYCSSLSNIVIPNSVNSVGSYAFKNCYSLLKVVMKQGVNTIGDSAFENCESLTSFSFSTTITSIGSNAFRYCWNIGCYDFSQHVSIPTLRNAAAIERQNSAIVVPDELYDSWIVATNWSSISAFIVKKTDWDNGYDPNAPA